MRFFLLSLLAIGCPLCAKTEPLHQEFAMIPPLSKESLLDLSNIYKEKGFSYSLPKSVLESWFSGKAYDNPTAYSEAKKAALQEDTWKLFQEIVSKPLAQGRNFVTTAGAPGAGKTLLLEQHLSRHGQTSAYVCPDATCLKGSTVYAEGRKAGVPLPDLYTELRPWSNGAAHLLLATLLREGADVYFGSTSSGPGTSPFFKFLKEKGYTITLLHVSAPDDVRWKSIQERDKEFVQTTEEDVRKKASLVVERIQDTFLRYVDRLAFYYRPEVGGDALLAAEWIRGEQRGTLAIYIPKAYEEIKRIHNTAARALGKSGLLWEATVENPEYTDVVPFESFP